MEVIFVPVKYKPDLKAEFMQKIAEIPCKNIGLFTTVQFLNQLSQLETFLKSKKKKVLIGKPSYRALEKGQVLGCDITSPKSIAEKVDCFVYLGTGFFHSISVALETNKPVYQANPTAGIVKLLDEKELNRYKILRKNAISKAKSAKIYGILVCTKKGQCDLKSAESIKKSLEKKGKKAYIFMFETIIPESLLDFPQIEAWVNTACPRMAIDDIERFEKPIVNWSDL